MLTRDEIGELFSVIDDWAEGRTIELSGDVDGLAQRAAVKLAQQADLAVPDWAQVTEDPSGMPSKRIWGPKWGG